MHNVFIIIIWDTKFIILQSDFLHYNVYFIHIFRLSRWGPQIEPCGTPLLFALVILVNIEYLRVFPNISLRQQRIKCA